MAGSVCCYFSGYGFFGPVFRQLGSETCWPVPFLLVPDFGNIWRVLCVAGHATAPACQVVGVERDY